MNIRFHSMHGVTVLAALTAAITIALTPASAVAQASGSRSLTILSLGGTYQEAQSKHWFQPFAQSSGLTVKEAAGYNYAKLRVMAKSGNVEADLIDTSADTASALAAEGLLETIDYSKLPASCLKGIPADMRYSFAFPTIQWSMVMAYNTDRFPAGKAPSSWADFWNTERFPGKRASIGATRPPIEQAALAMNGGKLDSLYPIDLDAAFNKIRSLGNNLVFADGYAQVAQYLVDGEADIVIIPNGRIAPLLAAKRPVAINWNQHIRFPNFFSIPKGAPNKENAMKFLAYVCQPEVLARVAEPTQYGPINVDAYQFISAAVAAQLPGNPTTAALGRTLDVEWMSKARPDIAKKWAGMAVR
ncbi:MAG: extracellular solute-binding protein [Burkholderiaceae bacterium]